MVATSGPAGIYDAALLRRQALMGSSGPAALIKNRRVFMIAMFACIGGLLYGLLLHAIQHPRANWRQVTIKVSFQVSSS